MAEMDNKVLLGLIGLISGVIGMMFRYISNLKEKLQFKDVCEATHRGLNETLDAKFDGMRDTIEQRFDNLEDLVKKNGGSHSQD